MSSDKDYLAGLPPKFEFVRVDPNSKTRFILRCRECGYEFSRIKYSISKISDGCGCDTCWVVGCVMDRPHVWRRLVAQIEACSARGGRTELEELERIYALPDPR